MPSFEMQRVLVFTNGWHLKEGAFHMASSKTTSTSPAVSFRTARIVTDPGSTLRKRLKRSGEAMVNCFTPMRDDKDFRSTIFSHSTTTRKWCLPFLSLTKMFLVFAPGMGGTRRSASLQVNTGGWS